MTTKALPISNGGFGEQEFILGRGQVIPGHTLISSKQIRLYTEIAGDGAEQVWIENVGRNPIMVNNIAMEKGAKRMLENGSSIVIVQKKYKKKELVDTGVRPRWGPLHGDTQRKKHHLREGRVQIRCHIRGTPRINSTRAIAFNTCVTPTHAYIPLTMDMKTIHLKILHLDLKPENILFDKKSGQVKLADFGFSQYLKQGGVSSLLHNDEEHVKLPVKGSEPYMSPEMTKEIYCPEGDLWSVGVVLYAMLAKQLPFGQGLPRSIMFEKIRKGKFGYGKRFQELHEEVKEGEKVIKVIRPAISDQAKEVINGLLTVDRDSRWTIQQVRNSKWVTGFGSPSFENSSSNGQGPSSKKRKPSIDSSTTSNTATTESRILSHEATSPKKQKTGTSAEGGESRGNQTDGSSSDSRNRCSSC
eukprot:jgi/Bigna1/80337/fgenesh1_pg.70_\